MKKRRDFQLIPFSCSNLTELNLKKIINVLSDEYLKSYR